MTPPPDLLEAARNLMRLRGVEEYDNGAQPFASAEELLPGETVLDLVWRLLTYRRGHSDDDDLRRPRSWHMLEIRIIAPPEEN